MSSISFKNAEETVSNNKTYLACGIHEVTMEELFFQPVGPCLKGTTKKDKSVINFNQPCLRLKIKVNKTNKAAEGVDCKGAETILMFGLPKEGTTAGGKDKVEYWKNRVLHLFANMSKVATKDKAKAYITGLEVDSFEALVVKLKHFDKRDVRLKFVANDSGFPQLPGWESGFAECIDVPFENTELKYDPIKEGPKSGPVNAEIPQTTSGPELNPWELPETDQSIKIEEPAF